MKMKTSMALLGMVLTTGWLGPACGGGSSAGGTAGAGAAGTGAAGTTGSGRGGASGTGGQAGTGPSCATLTATSGISVVNGPQIGVGGQANSALRKTITATDKGPNPMFTVTGAWILHPTSRANLQTRVIGTGLVALAYHGSAPICTVMLQNFTYRDAAGTDLDQSVGAGNTLYVAGGDALTCDALPQPMKDCLAPGETGWAFSTFVTSPTTAIASSPIVAADFTITGNTGVPVGQPDFKVAVTGYSVDTVDMTMPQVLHLTLQNQGTKSIGLGSAIPFFILDDQGLPLYHSTIFYTPMVLAPNQTLMVTENDVELDGAATRIRFHVEATHP